MVRRIALLKLKPTCSEEDCVAMIDAFLSLPDLCPPLRRASVGRVIRQVGDFDIAAVFDFDTVEDSIAFVTDEEHLRIAEAWRKPYCQDDVVAVDILVDA